MNKIFANKYLYIGLFVLVFGIALNQVASFYLQSTFKVLPILPDLILNRINEINTPFVYSLTTGTIIALFIAFTLTRKLSYSPYFLIVFGISQILRAFFIILTPFGSPNGGAIAGISSFVYGVYPSGHVSTGFLAFLLADKPFKKIILFLMLLTILFLFIAHGHYSIDILSAILFSYAIYCFSEKYLKNKIVPTRAQ